MVNNDCFMTSQYTTATFNDIWCSAEDFKKDLNESAFKGCMQDGSVEGQKDNVSLLFYLLYAKYGNTPIANNDITQFKYKVFSVMYQYGPTWEKKTEIQEKLRNLTEAELLAGSKAIYNSALNPSTAPSTQTLEELNYINSQNTTNYKKSKMEAYSLLWEILDSSLTANFVNKFSICFKKFVFPEKPLLFADSDED